MLNFIFLIDMHFFFTVFLLTLDFFKTENSPVALLFFLHLLRQPTDVNFQSTLKIILS